MLCSVENFKKLSNSSLLSKGRSILPRIIRLSTQITKAFLKAEYKKVSKNPKYLH